MLDRESWFIWAILVIVVALFVFAAVADDRDRKDFMAQCLEERKEYECKAMWKAGAVTPVPIIVPMVR